MDESNLTNQVIAVEKELLALKQKRGYISTLSAGYYKSESNLSAGRHTITYEAGDYPIISFLFSVNTEFRITGMSTPNNNKQYFWLSADRPITVIASRKIISVD